MAHQIIWFDLPVLDLGRAIRFYSNVLQTEIKEEFPGVAVFKHGEGDVAGCLFTSEDQQPSKGGALMYFNASGRLPEAVAKVPEFGGEVESEPHEIAPFGQRAIVIDSEGNRIVLHSE